MEDFFFPVLRQPGETKTIRQAEFEHQDGSVGHGFGKQIVSEKAIGMIDLFGRGQFDIGQLFLP